LESSIEDDRAAALLAAGLVIPRRTEVQRALAHPDQEQKAGAGSSSVGYFSASRTAARLKAIAVVPGIGTLLS